MGSVSFGAAAGRRKVTTVLGVLACVCVALAVPAECAGGLLDSIRDDVRSSAPRSSSSHDDHHHGSDDDDDGGSLLGDIFGFILTDLFFGNRSDSSDSCHSGAIHYEASVEFAPEEPDPEYYFPRFPYDRVPGYMMAAAWARADVWAGRTHPSHEAYHDQDNGMNWPAPPRRWAGRFRVDYADSCAELDRIGGHLLLTSVSRWGLDTETSFFEETLPGGAYDKLWMGDCNLVYRFGQHEHTQWRAGLGFNWLDDPIDTDFGFNFTWGIDFFPRRPWVFSAELDWGTLGRAELFHFRTTAGAIFHGIEAYIGYEYYDVDRTQINSLIAGVRVWF